MAARTTEQIAAHIRDLRVEAGITQADVALELQLDKSAVSRIESGERGLAVGELPRFAHALGVRVDDILFSDVEEEALLRADDDTHVAQATALTDTFLDDFLYVDALVG